MTKYETQGIDPKLPAQAITTIIAFLLSYYGIDLDPVLAGAISVVVGGIIGALAPAPKTKLSTKERRARPRIDHRSEGGFYDPMYVLLFLIVLLVVVWLAIHLFSVH